MTRVHKYVLRFVAEATTRVTVPALEKALVDRFDLTKKDVKAVVRKLVSDGELAYTYEFGSTFLELSFNKPVRVSTHVVIKPPGHHFEPASDDMVIEIMPGAAFGDGRHPTSRLSIRSIEYLVEEFKSDLTTDKGVVLDIGTGSGILILAAIRMGIHRGLGIDIDPTARAEAKKNVAINRLEDRIEISDQYLETIDGSFNLVVANLRYPTLKKIAPILRKLTCPKGFIACSGIRSHELDNLILAFRRKGFKYLWKGESHDWVGAAFQILD